MPNTHWRRFDFRIESLKTTVSGLEESITKFKRIYDECAGYDGISLLEETEPIYGLGFIAIQSYINSSIYDRFDSLDKQYLMYKIGNKIFPTERTEIELIVSVANYFKHRDHPNLVLGETAKILTELNLEFRKDVDITDSPIFKGINMLSENWDLNELEKCTEIWRNRLWEY